MQLLQNLGELHTHEDLPQVDDLPKALEFYGARIGRDLGRLHELTGGKITIGFIVETASIYEHITQTEPEDIPERSPKDIFEKDLLPYMESLEVTVEEIADDEVATNPPTR
jgi:hypothetical protein